MVAEYGLELPGFMIENVSLPAEVEAAIDKRTASGVAGDLVALHRVQRRRGDDQGRRELRAAAAAWARGSAWAWAWRWPSAWRAAALGARRPPRRGPPPPPPPPAEPRWHVAADGAAKGPYTQAELRLMAASGEL